MSGQCVSWMVVSSDTTRIDTEALVGDVLFLRRIREALDSQLGAAHSLNQELCAHQCGGVLQRLCALGAQLPLPRPTLRPIRRPCAGWVAVWASFRGRED